MTSTSIYTPFTYCITFLLTGQRYYGVRYSEKEMAHPDQLWTTYFTSSKTITDLIEEHGKDSFSVQIRKIFINKESACLWETKFLTRINAAKSPDWLNGNNGNGKFYDFLNSSNSPESIQKAKDTRKRNGTSATMKNPITIQKVKDTKIRNGTTNPFTPESIQKSKDTKKRNGTSATMKNPETVQKSKDTKKERGIISPMKIPFLSIIHNQKTYVKSHISRFFPELKQFY